MPIPLPTVGAHDIVSNSAHGSAAFSVTVPAGTNRLLVVGIHYVRNAEIFVSTVTFGAASLSLATTTFVGGTALVTEVWYLAGPAAGTDTLTVTWGGTNNVTTHLLVPVHAVNVRQTESLGGFASSTSGVAGESQIGLRLKYVPSRVFHFDSRQASGAQAPHGVPINDPPSPYSTQPMTELYDINTDEGGPQSGDLTGYLMTGVNVADGAFTSVAQFTNANDTGRRAAVELIADDALLPLDKDFEPHSLLMPFAGGVLERDWDPLHDSPQPLADFAAGAAEGNWFTEWSLFDSPLPFVGWPEIVVLAAIRMRRLRGVGV